MIENGASNNFEMLNDTNFNSGKVKIVLILAFRDLDEYIEEENPCEVMPNFQHG